MKIHICIPGSTFGVLFVRSLIATIKDLGDAGLDVIVFTAESPNVYWAREKCLGGDVRKGPDQKPFDGAEYDYVLWIDSDMAFQNGQARALIERAIANKFDILSALYRVAGLNNVFCAVEHLDAAEVKANGRFAYMSDDRAAFGGFLPVSFTGFGFILVSKAAHDAVKYPWFEPRLYDLGSILGWDGCDAAFCRKAAEAGFKTHVDTRIRVGHTKAITLI